MNKYLRVLRPEQWYKNVLVFSPLLLSGDILNVSNYPLLILSFISLCVMSGIIYIINDLCDYDSDRINPEKQHRPIASGEISLDRALIYSMILFLPLAIIAVKVPLTFVFCIFINGSLYNLIFKKHELLDIISLSSNYVFRVLQGYLVTNIEPDNYLLICVFLFAMMMSSGKRIGEYKLLKNKSREHRTTLTEEYVALLETILPINCAMFMVFMLIILEQMSIYILPLISYLIGRYIMLINKDPYKIRNPQALFRDKMFRYIFILTCLIILLGVGDII